VRKILIAGALCASAWSLPAPGTAVAGTYTVWSCRGPAGEPLTASAWAPAGDPGVQRSDGCAAGGALVAAVVGEDDERWKEAGARGGYEIAAPAGEAIVGYRIWRSARASGDHPWWHGGSAAVLEDGAPVAVCDLGACGDPSQPLADANLVERSAVHVEALGLQVACDSRGDDCEDGAELRLFRSAVTLSDDAAPVAAGPVSGGTTLALPAADAGAGLRSAVASLDGRPVAEDDLAACSEPYTGPQPCPATATFTLAVDTSALAPGPHRLDVVISDAAGNEATLLERTIDVASAGAVLGGEASHPPAAFAIRLDRSRASAGGAGSIGATVVSRQGSPVGGARVLVAQRGFGPRGGGWQGRPAVVADGRGRIAVPVPATPHELRFALPGRRRSARTVDVLAPLRLSAHIVPPLLRNGQSMVLSGRLAGIGRAPDGKRVEVQVIAGGRWLTVGRPRAGADGRFAWRYRFHRTVLEAIYSFRVRVPGGSARWPWSTTATGRLHIHVLP
jgi:hypothetical protein